MNVAELALKNQTVGEHVSYIFEGRKSLTCRWTVAPEKWAMPSKNWEFRQETGLLCRCRIVRKSCKLSRLSGK